MKPSEAKRKIGSLNKRYYKNIDALISGGMGNLKPSEMRKMQNPPELVKEHLSFLDQFAELNAVIRGES